MSVYNPATKSYVRGQPTIQPTAQGYAVNVPTSSGANQTVFYNNPTTIDTGRIDSQGNKILETVDFKSNTGESLSEKTTSQQSKPALLSPAGARSVSLSPVIAGSTPSTTDAFQQRFLNKYLPKQVQSTISQGLTFNQLQGNSQLPLDARIRIFGEPLKTAPSPIVIQQNVNALASQAQTYASNAAELESRGKIIESQVQSYNEMISSKKVITQAEINQGKALQSLIETYNNRAGYLDLQRSELLDNQSKVQEQIRLYQKAQEVPSKQIASGTIVSNQPSKVLNENKTNVVFSQKITPTTGAVVQSNVVSSSSQPNILQLTNNQIKAKQSAQKNLDRIVSEKPIFGTPEYYLTVGTGQPKKSFQFPNLKQANELSRFFEGGIVGFGQGIGEVTYLTGVGITETGKQINLTFPTLVPTIFPEKFVSQVKQGTKTVSNFLYPSQNLTLFPERVRSAIGTEFEYGTYLLPGGLGIARNVQATFLETDPNKIIGNLGTSIVLSSGIGGAAGKFADSKYLIPVTKGLSTIGVLSLASSAIENRNLTQEQQRSELAKYGSFGLGSEIYAFGKQFFNPESVQNLILNARSNIIFKPQSTFQNELGNQMAVAGYRYKYDIETGQKFFPGEIIFPKGQSPTNTELVHEFGHKLITENNPNIPLKIEDVLQDFEKLADKKPFLLANETFSIMRDYKSDQQFEESLVRFASNFPQELVKPTTLTGEVLSDIYRSSLRLNEGAKLAESYNLLSRLAVIGASNFLNFNFGESIGNKPENNLFPLTKPLVIESKISPSTSFFPNVSAIEQGTIPQKNKSIDLGKALSEQAKSSFTVTPEGKITQVSGGQDELSLQYIKDNLKLFENPRGTTTVDITSKPGTSSSTTITKILGSNGQYEVTDKSMQDILKSGVAYTTRTDNAFTEPTFDYNASITQRKFYGVGDPFFRATYQEALNQADISGQLFGGQAANFLSALAIAETNLNPFYPRQTKEILTGFLKNEQNQQTFRNVSGTTVSAVEKFITGFSFPTASTFASKFQNVFPEGLTIPEQVKQASVASQFALKLTNPVLFLTSPERTVPDKVTGEDVFGVTKTAVEFTLPRILAAPFTFARDTTFVAGKYGLLPKEYVEPIYLIEKPVLVGERSFPLSYQTPEQLVTEFKTALPPSQVARPFTQGLTEEEVRYVLPKGLRPTPYGTPPEGLTGYLRQELNYVNEFSSKDPIELMRQSLIRIPANSVDDPLYAIFHATRSNIGTEASIEAGKYASQGLFGSPANRLSPYFLELEEKPSLLFNFSFGTPKAISLRVTGFQQIPSEYRGSLESARFFINEIAPTKFPGIGFPSPEFYFGKTEAEVIIPVNTLIKQIPIKSYPRLDTSLSSEQLLSNFYSSGQSNPLNVPANFIGGSKFDDVINKIFGNYYLQSEFRGKPFAIVNYEVVNQGKNAAPFVEKGAMTLQKLLTESSYANRYARQGLTLEESVTPIALGILNLSKSSSLSSSTKPVEKISYSTFDFSKVGFLPSLSLPKTSGGISIGDVPYEPPVIPPYIPPTDTGLDKGTGSSGGGDSGGGDSGGGDSGGGDSGGGDSGGGDSGGGDSGGSSGGGSSGGSTSGFSSFGSGGSGGGSHLLGSSTVVPLVFPIPITYPKRKKSKVVPAFDVFVKKRVKVGKNKFKSAFIKQNKNPFLTYNEALALGIARTDVPIQQSFEVLQNLNFTEARNFAIPQKISKYYQKKNKPNVFIENRRYAIDNPVEVLQLKQGKRTRTRPLTFTKPIKSKAFKPLVFQTNNRKRVMNLPKTNFFGKKLKFKNRLF